MPRKIALFVLLSACGSPANGPPDGGAGVDALSGFLSDGGTSCFAAGLAKSLGRDHLMIGFTGEDSVASAAPFDVRYVYISGGYADGAGPCASCASACDAGGKSCANSAGGCAWWGCYQYDQNPPGEYVRDFVSNAAKANEIPMFTYYEILQASGVQEGTAEATQAAADSTFMTRYFADYRFMLQQIGNSAALIHIEPDFWGYAEQEIDRIAAETASGIQQLEAAAGNMKTLSATMAEIVGRYKINLSSS